MTAHVIHSYTVYTHIHTYTLPVWPMSFIHIQCIHTYTHTHYLSFPVNEAYRIEKETYHTAKETYHAAKETYQTAKETYQTAKETCHTAYTHTYTYIHIHTHTLPVFPCQRTHASYIQCHIIIHTMSHHHYLSFPVSEHMRRPDAKEFFSAKR